MKLRRHRLPAWTAALVIFSFGCDVVQQQGVAAAGGDIAAGTGGAGGPVGSAGMTTFVGAGSGGFYPTQELCMPNPPVKGDWCLQEGQMCEYGDDPRTDCRTVFFCETPGPDSAVWYQYTPVHCPPHDSDLCPPEPDTSGLCANPDALCIYADGTQCGCVSMQWYKWSCVPPPGAACPSSAPNFGQPCFVEGVVCQYGSCDLGTWAVRGCVNGVWADRYVPCL